MINLFGNGFIGKHFSNLYPCVINKKNDVVPNIDNAKDILYTIGNINNDIKTKPCDDIDSNLITLIKVLENFKNNPKSKNVVFNYASTCVVYGETNLPASEETYCNPTGFYGITKRFAEQCLISYCEAFDLKYRILRFSNVLGQGDKKISIQKNAVTYMITEMKYNKPINLYDNGSSIRDFIHVTDLCKAVKLIMDKGELNQIYNIGNGIPYTIKTIIDKVKTLGSISEINNIVSPSFHNVTQVKEMYLDIKKLQQLGFVPEYSLDEMIRELYASS